MKGKTVENAAQGTTLTIDPTVGIISLSALLITAIAGFLLSMLRRWDGAERPRLTNVARWLAPISGWATAFLMSVVLYVAFILFGLSLGRFFVANPAVPIFVAAFALFSTIVAYFVGGFVAGRAAGAFGGSSGAMTAVVGLISGLAAGLALVFLWGMPADTVTMVTTAQLAFGVLLGSAVVAPISAIAPVSVTVLCIAVLFLVNLLAGYLGGKSSQRRERRGGNAS